MNADLEILFWIFMAFVFYVWISNRTRKAIQQIRQEEFYREVLRRSEQQKKIDLLAEKLDNLDV